MERARRPARPKKRPVQYRHELKYYINRGDYEILSRRLRSCMQQDENAIKNGGEYFIRSLYFDSPFDDALWEKLSGTDERDKFRIRIYNGQDDVIKLECKHKGRVRQPYRRGLRLSHLPPRALRPAHVCGVCHQGPAPLRNS